MINIVYSLVTLVYFVNQLETDESQCLPASSYGKLVCPVRHSLMPDTNGRAETFFGWPATSRCATEHSVSLGVHT